MPLVVAVSVDWSVFPAHHIKLGHSMVHSKIRRLQEYTPQYYYNKAYSDSKTLTQQRSISITYP